MRAMVQALQRCLAARQRWPAASGAACAGSAASLRAAIDPLQRHGILYKVPKRESGVVQSRSFSQKFVGSMQPLEHGRLHGLTYLL